MKKEEKNFDFITKHVISTKFFFKQKIDLNLFNSHTNTDYKTKEFNRVFIFGGKNSGKSFVLMNIFDSDTKELFKDDTFLYKRVDNVLMFEPYRQLNENEFLTAIYNSSIIIYVVRSYGYKDQIMVNKISKIDKTKTLIVIHNSLSTNLDQIHFHYQNYQGLLKKEASLLNSNKKGTSLGCREHTYGTNLIHFFLMNNQYEGINHNLQLIRTVNSIIGTFLGIGNVYDANPQIIQKNIPSYEIKKENKTLSIVVEVPLVTDINVNTSIKTDNNTFNFNFTGKKEGKNVELKIVLPYHEYLVTNARIDKDIKKSYGKITYSFPLLQ